MKIVKFILVLVPAALAILSGLLKITGAEQIVTALTAVNMKPYMVWMGLAEIIFAVLFLVPKTRTIGFVLLICYFSGAMATDLSHGRPIVAPLFFLVLLFAAQVINHPEIFIQTSGRRSLHPDLS
jgi:hypothetical protein